jgi:hypothetical protein
MMYGAPIGVVRVTADSVAKATSGGTLVYVTLVAGSDATSIIIYDNPSAASGTVIANVKVVAADTRQIFFYSPITAGLYADITGTGAIAYIGHT